MLGSMALWAADIGNGNEALALVGRMTAGQRSMRLTNHNPTVRAWAAVVEATAHAAVHRADAAFAALALAKPGDEPAWPWLTPFSDVKLSASVGHVATMLGRPKTAIPALLDALPTAPAKARVRTLGDLATCYRVLGQHDDATRVASEARELAASTGTRRL